MKKVFQPGYFQIVVGFFVFSMGVSGIIIPGGSMVWSVFNVVLGTLLIALGLTILRYDRVPPEPDRRGFSDPKYPRY